MMTGSDSGRASVMSSSDSLESSKLKPTLVALQQGPRPLPFFLKMAQHETTGDAARLAHILAGLSAFQAAPRPSSEEHTSELQSLMPHLQCRHMLEKKSTRKNNNTKHKRT